MVPFFRSRFPSVCIRVQPWTKFPLLLASASLRFALLLTLAGCSIPNLQSASCVDSRNTLREFYSFHFGNNMLFSQEDLKLRERFLTAEFAEKMRGSREGTDPFTTATDDVPKAFRAGECREVSPERTVVEVVLFWKDDHRSEERKIDVEMAKRGGAWLVDGIARK